MSKERLAEIEERILKIDEDDSTNRSKMLDYRHWAYELLKIANEQAERVQELEEAIADYAYEIGKRKRALNKKNEQNKRYRGALEEISKPIYGVTYADMFAVKQLARKALEGEE